MKLDARSLFFALDRAWSEFGKKENKNTDEVKALDYVRMSIGTKEEEEEKR